MADLVYGVSHFQRQRGDFPDLPVVNMLAEEVQTEPGTALQSRPGLEDTDLTFGSGPVRGLFQVDGILDSNLFGVSGLSLYKDGASVGSISGTGHVSFGGYEDMLFVNAEEDIWVHDGSTTSQVTFPDGADVAKIVVGASRLIAIRKNTGQFYWSDVLSSNIDGLSFATAENSPDKLKDMLFIGDRLYLFGAETTEIWPVSGDSDLPFTPLIGSVLPVGIKTTGCAVEFSNSFAWISNHNEVLVGSPDNMVSSPELQVKIQDSEHVKLWRFYVDDFEYLAVTLDTETWVLGARSGVWSKFESYEEDNWVCISYAGGYFGTTRGGVLSRWSDSESDYGGVLERRFRAWAAITSEVINVGNIVLRTNPGTTPYLEGTYSNPIVELRTSRNGGKQWQPYKAKTLGETGQYLRKTFWSSMGQFSYPGLLIEIRMTDPTPFRVSGLVFNEPFGGR